MTPRTLILQWKKRLAAAGVADAAVDASQLLARVTGRPMLDLRMDDDTLLTDAELVAFETLALRRLDREPLQYILGDAPFCGRDFTVTPAVLIPRPETELLAEWALEELRDRPAAAVLDLCCGSGCLGITLRLEAPESRVTCADISHEALTVTRWNAEKLAAEIAVCRGDLWQAVGDARFDVIVSNPPYIPTADCAALQEEVLREPALALDGGADGLDIYRRIADGAVNHLTPGGTLLLELGIGEADAVTALLKRAGMTDLTVRRDLEGIERMLLARAPKQ